MWTTNKISSVILLFIATAVILIPTINFIHSFSHAQQIVCTCKCFLSYQQFGIVFSLLISSHKVCFPLTGHASASFFKRN